MLRVIQQSVIGLLLTQVLRGARWVDQVFLSGWDGWDGQSDKSFVFEQKKIQINLYPNMCLDIISTSVSTVLI